MSINRAFPPRYFSDTDVNRILLQGDRNVTLLTKSEQNREIYDNFNQQFYLFLNKLPNNSARKVVTDLYNRDLIYILISSSRHETGIVSRAFIDNQGRCYGVGLLNAELDIDIRTGDVSNVDECVYAAYQGLIRASSIIFKDNIKRDHDLHKLLATYFYLVILKGLGRLSVYSQKQKNFIYLICIYAYYRHYLDENPRAIKSIIEKRFRSEGLIEYYDEFEKSFSLLEKYKSVKDLPRMLIDTKVLVENPNSINMSLMRNLKMSGYYSLIGPLELLLSMAILSKYPTDLYTRSSYAGEKLQNSIETIFMRNYINKIRFGSSDIFKRE